MPKLQKHSDDQGSDVTEYHNKGRCTIEQANASGKEVVVVDDIRQAELDDLRAKNNSLEDVNTKLETKIKSLRDKSGTTSG